MLQMSLKAARLRINPAKFLLIEIVSWSWSCAGKTRARDAALNAIQSPLLDIGIERATGIVWNITGGSDLTLFEVSHSLPPPA